MTVCQREYRIVRGDGQVAAADQAHAGSGNRALDAGDDGLAHAADGEQRQVQQVDALHDDLAALGFRHFQPFFHHPDVTARHEVIAGSFDHDAPDIVVEFQVADHIAEPGSQFGCQSVANFGRIQGYGCHAIGNIEQNRVTHAGKSFSSRKGHSIVIGYRLAIALPMA